MVPSCALQNNLPSLDSAADDATSFSNHTAARRHSFIQSEGSIISLVPSEEEISTGGGVGVCNALVLLYLGGHQCTFGGMDLLNIRLLSLVSGSTSTLRVGGIVTPATSDVRVPASMMPINCGRCKISNTRSWSQ